MNILFVCTGNTCRSPMAQGIFGAKNTDVYYDSAAIMQGGATASENAALAMSEMGIDITNHVSKQVDTDLIKWADLILTMTTGHKQILVQVFGDAINKIFTLREYTGDGGDIADPYGQDLDVYRRCAQQIEQEIDKVVKKLSEYS